MIDDRPTVSRVIAAGGKWMVPPEERPQGWQQMVMSASPPAAPDLDAKRRRQRIRGGKAAGLQRRRVRLYL